MVMVAENEGGGEIGGEQDRGNDTEHLPVTRTAGRWRGGDGEDTEVGVKIDG